MERINTIYLEDTNGPVMITEGHYNNIINGGHVILIHNLVYHKAFDVLTEENYDMKYTEIVNVNPFDDYATDIIEATTKRKTYYFEWFRPNEGYILYNVNVEPSAPYVIFSEPRYFVPGEYCNPDDEA